MQRNKIISLIAITIVLTIGTMNVAATTRTVTIRVEGMHCNMCAASVEKKLKATPGVEEAKVSFEKGEAWVKFDDSKVSEAQLREAINSTGYKAVETKAASR
jgi:copper chaperone CopZ